MLNAMSKNSSNTPESPASDEFKTCPYCKERIRMSAIKCRFCGEWIEPPDEPSRPIRQERDVRPTVNALPPENGDSEDPGRERRQQAQERHASQLRVSDATRQLKVATLLYLVPVTYFLFVSANWAWAALPADRRGFSNGVIITTFLLNALTGFVARALFSPLGILCLAVYSYYVWSIQKTRRAQERSAPSVGQKDVKGTETANLMEAGIPVPESAHLATQGTARSGDRHEPLAQIQPPSDTSPDPRTTEEIHRPGLKAAAVFLIVNAVLTFLLSVFLQGGAASALSTSTLYRSMFFGDIICALALLSGWDVCRWYVVARTIYGALHWGIATPIIQGTALGWLTGSVQLLFMGGLLGLALIKGPPKSRIRWAVASVIIALLSISSLNAVRLVQYQQTKKTLLVTMPWISPELMDMILKEMVSRNLTEAEFQQWFSTALDRGQQQLAPTERDEITQIYGIAYDSLGHDEAALFSSYASKVRLQQSLTEGENDQFVQLTTKMLSGLRDPHKARFQQLMTKAFEAARLQP